MTIAAQSVERRRAYWRYNLRLTVGLLSLWLVVTFAPAYWARDFNRFTLFGWPLGFHVAAQGALIAYLLIVWVYAKAMDRLDGRFAVEEGGSAPGQIGHA